MDRISVTYEGGPANGTAGGAFANTQTCLYGPRGQTTLYYRTERVDHKGRIIFTTHLTQDDKDMTATTKKAMDETIAELLNDEMVIDENGFTYFRGRTWLGVTVAGEIVCLHIEKGGERTVEIFVLADTKQKRKKEKPASKTKKPGKKAKA